MSYGKCNCGRVFCDFPYCELGQVKIGDYFEHREPCECPACQAGAYCIREIERVAGHCGE